jgi:hypothetical protein
MAFLPGIFGNRNQQPQQQNPQQQQPNQQQQPAHQPAHQPNPQNNQPNGGGGAGPVGNQMNGPANQNYNPNGNPGNPLDPFINLMTPSKEVQTARQNQQQQQEAPIFGDQFTGENIGKHLSSADFMHGVNPETVSKALGGDAQSFSEVINAAVRNAVSTSVQMSKGMVEHGVKTGTDRFGNTLDSRIRNFQLNSQTSKNPALQHPIGKALMTTVVRQIAEANPKMSAEEASAKGEELFSQFASMLTAKDGKEGNQESGPKKMDWTSFLDDPQQAQV